jgi:hypothetical protein
MDFLVRALTFYAWYVATTTVVFAIVLAVLYLAPEVQKRTKQLQFEVLQVLRRRSGLG